MFARSATMNTLGKTMNNILALQIDTRESDWLKTWDKRPPKELTDTLISVQMLENGDAKVWCTDGSVLLIERKTPSDFLNSIPSDHIFDQAARMMAERESAGVLPFLIVTGEIHRNPQTGMCIIPGQKHGEGWNWDAVQGALLTIQEVGVPVIFCASEMEYGAALDRLARRNKRQMIINPTREIIPLSAQERVLCAFDGIGPDLARAILEKCSSLGWAFDVLTDMAKDAPKIPGVAFGRKQMIVKTLFGTLENAKLSVCDTSESAY